MVELSKLWCFKDAEKFNFFVLFLFSFLAFLNHGVLHATILASLESYWWIGVQQLGFRLFRTTMWKLLIIEPFCQWKLNIIKTESYLGCSWCHWKTLNKWDLIEFISQFSELGVEDIDIWMDVVAKSPNKLQKLGLEGKINWALNVFHTWANNKQRLH